MKRPLIAVNITLFGRLLSLLIMFGTDHLLSANPANTSGFSDPPERVKLKGTDEELYGPYKRKSLKELWDIRKEFFKSGHVPTDPETVKRLWQWYRTMDEKDPAFKSKTPIQFYGKVIDQYGEPISSAAVDMSWGKGTNYLAQTLSNGYFSLSGVTGSSLSVFVKKEGYLIAPPPIKCFNYANWLDYYFHIPNATNPVVFRLMKLENPEPMYVCSLRPKVDVVGTEVWVNVASGKKEAAGDIGFSVVRDAGAVEDMPGAGYTLTILSPAGGGMVITNEEFMFHAPETGYAERIEMRQDTAMPDAQSWHRPMKLKLYLKTTDNKYAAIEVTVGQFARPEAWVDLLIFFNPSGSRNLEMDPGKRLDANEAKRIRKSEQNTAK